MGSGSGTIQSVAGPPCGVSNAEESEVPMAWRRLAGLRHLSAIGRKDERKLDSNPSGPMGVAMSKTC